MKFTKTRKKSHKRKTHKRRERHNPTTSHRAYPKRRRRSVRRNPSGSDVIELVKEIGVAGAGGLGGLLIQNLGSKYLPAKFAYLAPLGGAVVLGVTMRKNPLAMRAALGMGVVGVLALAKNFLPASIFGADAVFADSPVFGYGADTATVPMGWDGDPNSMVPGVVDSPFGDENSMVPGVVDSPFGYDSPVFGYGADTSTVPMGDMEGEDLFGESEWDG